MWCMWCASSCGKFAPVADGWKQVLRHTLLKLVRFQCACVCACVCVCRKYLVRTSKSKQITTVLSDGLMGNTMISSTFLLANDPVKIPKSNQFIRILCHVFFLHPWYMYVIVCVCVFFLAYIKPLDTKNTSYLETPWKPHFPTPSKGTAPFPVIPSRCGSWK